MVQHDKTHGMLLEGIYSGVSGKWARPEATGKWERDAISGVWKRPGCSVKTKRDEVIEKW